MSKVKLPPLITTDDYIGYDCDELDKILGPKFVYWMRGQTVALHKMPDGKEITVCYKWDVDHYLAGLPPLD